MIKHIQFALDLNTKGVQFLAMGQANQALDLFKNAIIAINQAILLHQYHSIDMATKSLLLEITESIYPLDIIQFPLIMQKQGLWDFSKFEQKSNTPPLSNPALVREEFSCLYAHRLTSATVPITSLDDDHFYVYDNAILLFQEPQLVIASLLGRKRNSSAAATATPQIDFNFVCAAIMFNVALAYHCISKTKRDSKILEQVLVFYQKSLDFISFGDIVELENETYMLAVAAWNNISQIHYQLHNMEASQASFSRVKMIFHHCKAYLLFDNNTQRQILLNGLLLQFQLCAPCA